MDEDMGVSQDAQDTESMGAVNGASMGHSLVWYRMIPYVQASDFSSEVEDYCAANDISTHYDNDIAWVEDDGNVFAQWLDQHNIPRDNRGGGWYIAIGAT